MMKSKYEDYSVEELTEALDAIGSYITPDLDIDEIPPLTDEEFAELTEIMALLQEKEPLPQKFTAEESWQDFKATYAEELSKLGYSF